MLLALRHRNQGLTVNVRRWSAAPAKLANLGLRKGRLAAGFDADIVVRQIMLVSTISACLLRLLA